MVAWSYRTCCGSSILAQATTQRGAYRTNRLDSTRVKQLEALPAWVWEPHQATWESGYACLLRFVEREGHAAVPDGYLLSKRTTGVEPATFGLGSRRSTN